MSTETQPKVLPQSGPGELALFEHISNRWDARIAQGVDPKDLLVPSFWSLHAVKLRPMDELRARAEDGTWIGYFVVLEASRTWARMQMLSLHRCTTADTSLTQASADDLKQFKDGYKITWRSNAYKWSVVRKQDGAVVAENKEQKEDAQRWLDVFALEQLRAAHTEPAKTEA